MYMTIKVNIHQAKTQLSQLIASVEGGDDVIIARAGSAVAKLTAIKQKKGGRLPGSAKGKIRIADDFDDPLPQDLLRLFNK